MQMVLSKDLYMKEVGVLYALEIGLFHELESTLLQYI